MRGYLSKVVSRNFLSRLRGCIYCILVAYSTSQLSFGSVVVRLVGVYSALPWTIKLSSAPS